MRRKTMECCSRMQEHGWRSLIISPQLWLLIKTWKKSRQLNVQHGWGGLRRATLSWGLWARDGCWRKKSLFFTDINTGRLPVFQWLAPYICIWQHELNSVVGYLIIMIMIIIINNNNYNKRTWNQEDFKLMNPVRNMRDVLGLENQSKL